MTQVRTSPDTIFKCPDWIGQQVELRGQGVRKRRRKLLKDLHPEKEFAPHLCTHTEGVPNVVKCRQGEPAKSCFVSGSLRRSR